MILNSKEIYCVSDYLIAIDKLSELYPYYPFIKEAALDTFFFRGLPDIGYKLIPMLFRETSTPVNPIDDCAPIALPDEMNNDSNGPEAICTRNYTSIICEDELLMSFINEALAYKANLSPDDTTHWAELAQHFGTPTRFLDWTANSLVALFFACNDNFDKDGAVWILHTNSFALWSNSTNTGANAKERTKAENDTIKELIQSNGQSMASPSRPFLHTPHYYDQRMAAQSSHFMTWGRDESPLEEMIDERNIMDLNAQKGDCRGDSSLNNSRFLYRVIIRKHQKRGIMRELERIGINAKTLFPGLDGIGKYIEMRYHYYFDEHCH